MSIGPEPAFADIASRATLDRIQDLIDGPRPTRAECKEAMGLVYALIIDAANMAQAASDLLYLTENDPPESERIAAAERRLRQCMNSPHECIREMDKRTAARIATELGRSPDEHGTARLAAALGE